MAAAGRDVAPRRPLGTNVPLDTGAAALPACPHTVDRDGMSEYTKRVVVGVDCSEESRSALAYAARAAVARGASLRVVYAYQPAVWSYPIAMSPYPPEVFYPAPETTDLLTELVDEARLANPGLDVTQETVMSGAAAALVGASYDAALTVVGCRGLGGFKGLLLGSVSAQLATHAHGPVVVVRGDPGRIVRADAPVVLGVDVFEPVETAVEFAFDEAARSGAPIVAYHAWVPARGTAPEYSRQHAARAFGDVLAAWQEKYPGVPVDRRLVESDSPGEVLITASADAGLVVVGTHSRHEVGSMLLGSVAYALIHRAECPVAVVPPRG